MRVRTDCNQKGGIPLYLMQYSSNKNTRVNLKGRLIICLLMTSLSFFSFNAVDAFGDIIVDNGDPGTFSTGTWLPSYGANYYGSRSEYSNGANATYSFEADLNGTYEVSLWWTYYNNRCTSAVSYTHLRAHET